MAGPAPAALDALLESADEAELEGPLVLDALDEDVAANAGAVVVITRPAARIADMIASIVIVLFIVTSPHNKII